MKTVYIQRLAHFLPNSPVDNDEMEAALGQVGTRPSRARRVVLRSNGIRHRHYASDARTGLKSHNNAQLTAEAIRRLIEPGFALDDIDLLACGTSSPDQLMPNHAVMVHGELGGGACEAAGFAGICVSGVSALRYASLAVATGEANIAVATGSELASTFMCAGMFAQDESIHTEALEVAPELAFHRDFLRWMLSDGAGAARLSHQPLARGLSLRLDWTQISSFAHEMPVCMYAGMELGADREPKGWRDYTSPEQAARAGAFSVKQDVRLLNEHVVDVCFSRGLAQARRKYPLEATNVDWFVPHYSSTYFRPRLAAAMQDSNFVIPESRWFSRLADIGNVGSASIYLNLALLADSGALAKGQTVLCFIPESGRFTAAFMHMTVVDHEG